MPASGRSAVSLPTSGRHRPLLRLLWPAVRSAGSSGFYGQYVDIEGVYRNEFDLIKRYREMALHPEADGAIEDVVNEAIVSDLYDSPVEIELSNLNASVKLKKIIRDEFKNIKEIMDFDRKAHEIFRNWYVDGRVFYLKVIDVKAPQEGLQDLRYIDPLKMKFIRQEKKKPGNGDLSIRLRNNEDAVPNPEFDEYYLLTSGEGVLVNLTFIGSGDACLDDVVLSNSSGGSMNVSVGDCITIEGSGDVYGCTDSSACNYD